MNEITNFKREYPMISFIMPVYKDGDSVKAAIESIVDQDWPNVEVIAVNDCSPDNTKEILDELAKKHERLTVIHLPENRGACVARNEGAKIAKGKYYAWLPADAKLYPGMARVWVEMLEKYPDYDGLYGGYRFLTPTGEIHSNYMSQQFEPYMLEVRNYIDGSFPIKAETFWRVANLIGQPDGLWDPNVKSLQDWDFWLSVVKEGKGKLIYVQDVFFETTLPHAGGLSDDSHRNWLARTRQIKAKHGIPERKVCVTSPGAPFFAQYLAHLLDADYQEMPSLKQHDYDLIYCVGWYPSMAEKCNMVFCHPEYMGQYEQIVQERKFVPLAPAVKVVHLIGTDLLQMQHASRVELEAFRVFLNGKYDHVFTEFEETQKEAKELGLKTSILPIPPRQFFEPTPLPEKFTVAVYAPKINQALYSVDLMREVAKKLPEFNFKFFGNVELKGPDSEIPNIEHIGYVMEMDKFIANCSCLMRVTVHDGLPQSVLEFLSAGRRVIFNHDFKFVNTANKQLDAQVIADALEAESKLGLNEESPTWIRKNFDPEKFKKKMKALLKYDAKKYWDQRADNWIRVAPKFYGTKDWEHIKPFVEKINPQSVIDIGCGEGQWAQHFGGEYLGIDFAKALIKQAKKNNKDKEFMVASLQELPGKLVKKYDLAFCYTLFLHILEEDMPEAIEALKKVAKEVILIEPHSITTKYYQHAHDYDKWFKIKEKKQLGERTLYWVDLS